MCIIDTTSLNFHERGHNLLLAINDATSNVVIFTVSTQSLINS